MVHYDTVTEEMTCDCGNSIMRGGFLACDEEGLLVEPTPEDWTSLRYRCMDCGAVSEPTEEPLPERPPRPLPVVAHRKRGHYTVEMVHDNETFRLRFYVSPDYLADVYQAHREGRGHPLPPDATMEIVEPRVPWA